MAAGAPPLVARVLPIGCILLLGGGGGLAAWSSWSQGRAEAAPHGAFALLAALLVLLYAVAARGHRPLLRALVLLTLVGAVLLLDLLLLEALLHPGRLLPGAPPAAAGGLALEQAYWAVVGAYSLAALLLVLHWVGTTARAPAPALPADAPDVPDAPPGVPDAARGFASGDQER